MTAQEYFDKSKDKLHGTVEEFDAEILHIVTTMADEVANVCNASMHAKDDKYVSDMLKAQNCKWNEFVDIFDRHFMIPSESVLLKDGFLHFWKDKMPEFSHLLETSK